VYCSIDKIDLLTAHAAIQTDHRSCDEIAEEPELSALFAMARVLNARGHLAETGRGDAAVHYALTGDVPQHFEDALAAVGATLDCRGDRRALGPVSHDAIAAIADRAFSELARRAAHRIGTRDVAIALRMLEDQTFANPPQRDDEPEYWQRVLELAALAGELLRAKYPHATGWVQTDRAMMPFGFGIDPSTIMFPTNRAQRVIEDGADESLFKLLVAAEETMHDGKDGRLMPSLRDRRGVELDEIVWHSLLAEAGPADLPIVVCGIDGESTFGMIRREAIGSLDEAMQTALANLAAEPVDIEDARVGDLRLVVVSGSFYAAEKILDHALVQRMHDRLAADLLAVAVPTRGVSIFTTGALDAAQMARFAALVATRYDEAGGRAISPTILLLRDGRIAGFVDDERADRAGTAPLRADTQRESEKKPGLLRRLFGKR
jgi:hypothetical protein